MRLRPIVKAVGARAVRLAVAGFFQSEDRAPEALLIVWRSRHLVDPTALDNQQCLVDGHSLPCVSLTERSLDNMSAGAARAPF